MKKELLSCVLALCLTACAPAGSSAASLSPAAVPEYPKALSFDDYEGPPGLSGRNTRCPGS